MVEGNNSMNDAATDCDETTSKDLDGTSFTVDDKSTNQQLKEESCNQACLPDQPIVVEEEVQKAPDGGWGWFIVVGACLVHFIMGGFERSNGVLYLQLKSRYDHSATATSWVLSLFSTLRLAVGPIASALCNKYSCRTVVMMGATISSLGVLISAFVPDLPYLYFTYGVLGGVGRAFTYTPSLIIVGYYFNKRRGIAVGLSTSGVGFGSFLLPPIMEIMFDYYGFIGTFIILSAVMSHFFIPGALFRPLDLHRRFMENDRQKDARTEETGENLLTGVTQATRTQNLLSSQSAAKMSSSLELTANVKIESQKTSLFQRKLSKVKLAIKGTDRPKDKNGEKRKLLDLSLFRNFAFSALCIQLFLFTLSFNSTFVFLPALAEEKGVDRLQGAYLISILGIFDGIARIVMSSVLDLKRVKPFRLIIYNCVMFVVAIVSLLLPSMTSFWQFAIISGLYGVLSGTYIAQKSVVVVDILGVEHLSSAFGLLLMFQGLSGLVGPTVGGLLKDFLGTYDMAFYFGSIGIVAGGFTMAVGNIWLYKQKKLKEKQDKQEANGEH
ncbi:monocarboxylate transporter 12-like [Ruditapes philippinarum]|uniref:monocarboxylate transporter 12-like n=1 Tax=Ruditapes philippinarum TaxID=129788 RepID=UPI00295B6665|nr:monocarboxylate transporter 12-like [Ruditapes philippinarum]